MNWWKEFADRVVFDEPIAAHTWFRFGGPARYLFRPTNFADLSAMMLRATHQNIPVKVLGSGANVLISDHGFDGMVVRLDSPTFRSITNKGTIFTTAAGVDLMPLAKNCSYSGMAGLECMAGIPATIGGAVRMNAGGRFGEISQVVSSISVMDLNGEIEDWSSKKIGFSYRGSDLEDYIVISANLQLTHDDPERTRRRFDTQFAFKQQTQPLAERTAGCIFKNPSGQSAGELIDKAGLKGTQVGQVRVSRRHANFIEAGAKALAEDAIRLIQLIQERVHDSCGTMLELEIDIW